MFNHFTTKSVLIRISILLILGSEALALPNDEFWDGNFGIPGANGPVETIAIKGNEVYIGGVFSQVGGIAATNVAMWNGTNWNALGPGLGQYVGSFDIAVQAIAVMGNNVYFGGRFNNAGNLPVNNIAKWDGTNWSALGEGVNERVFRMATDGTTLLAGGHFSFAGSIPANRIARWDGTNWSSLGSGMASDFGSAFVHAIGIRDGNVYAGGAFTSAGSVRATNVARWDGTNWMPLGFGFVSGAVYSLAVASNIVYAGGSFTHSGSNPIKNLAQWNGMEWTSVAGSISRDRGGSYILALDLNGQELFIGGEGFSQVGGIDATNVACWNGQTWSALGGGAYSSIGSVVAALSGTGTELFLGGGFRLAGNKPSTNIARWHIPHALTSLKSGSNITLSWPATGSNFVLEAKSNLTATNWSPVGSARQVIGDQLVVTNPPSGSNAFYRLRR